MAAANFPVPAPMEFKGDLSSNWTFFRSQWDNYVIATELDQKDDVVVVASLLSVLGKECFRVYTHLDITNDERKNPKTICDKLEEHFKPTRNVIYERYVFNTTDQGNDETVDQYVHRLRHLASTCEFNALHDDLIRDRLVLGVKDGGARARMLRESKLTLKHAIDTCRASEISRKQLQSLNPKDENVHMLKHQHRKYADQKQTRQNRTTGKTAQSKPVNMVKCKFCGKEHELDRKKCPANNAQCSYCKKLHHFANMCRARKAQKSSSKVNFVENEELHDADFSDSDDYVFYVVQSVDKSKSKSKQWYVSLNLHYPQSKKKSAIECQLDSGSTCNLICYNDLCEVAQKAQPPLRQSNARLKLYDGSVMKPVGQVTLKCKFKGSEHELEFQVVEGKQRPLLSAETCESMGLMNVTLSDSVYSVKEDTPLTMKDINEQFGDVFEGLGCLPGAYKLEVDPSVKPVQHLPRRVAVALKQEVNDKIDDLVNKGVLAKVTEPTEWISSMVVVRKPNKIRICLDPKDLNTALRRSHYQIPTIEEILPRLGKAKVFSTLDAKDGFWQVKLDEESSYLTTFWTPKGRYRWLRMPFGIATAPEEYQRQQHEVLEGLPGVENIHDDILVLGCGDTIEEATQDHDRNLISLLERARSVNLKLNRSKLRLRQSELPFLGHRLTCEGLKPDPEKVRAVSEVPKPTDKKSMQRLIGFVNYLAKFLPYLSEVCEPLRRLMDKDAAWCWLTQHESAFQQIKSLVTSTPVLRYYDVMEEVTIQADASEVGLGATLLQNGQPVCFASRSLSPTEQRYAQIEKECLAVVFACERFDQYVYGREKITVKSDHKPLESIFKKSLLAAPKRLQRMMLRLQKYQLDVTYKPGSQMYIADFLSRASLPMRKCDHTLKDHEVLKITEELSFLDELEHINAADYISVSDQRLDQIQSHTQQDVALQLLKTTILAGWPDQREATAVSIHDYWNFREELTVQNGVLYKGTRVIIPPAMKPEMLQRIHASHQGVDACIRRARDSLYWPNMTVDIREHVAKCSTCCEMSTKQQKQPMMSHGIPDRPWSKIGADLFVLDGEDYLVQVDYYSDYWEVDKLTDTTSATVIDCMKEQFSRHGIPETVVTDNGPQLASQEFTKFSQEWEFNHVTTSPYHSQSNGKAESAVKISKRLIKKAKRDGKDVWKSILDWRNTPTDGMDSSPVQRHMSRRTRTSLPIASQMLNPKVIDTVKQNKTVKHQKAKLLYDKSAKELPELTKGQPVRVQPSSADPKAKWRYGTCVDQVSPRSYIVNVDGKEYRRNRKFLRSTVETMPAENISTEIQPEVDVPVPVTMATPAKTTPISSRSPLKNMPNSPVKSTRTRTIKPPERFKDFV